MAAPVSLMDNVVASLFGAFADPLGLSLADKAAENARAATAVEEGPALDPTPGFSVSPETQGPNAPPGETIGQMSNVANDISMSLDPAEGMANVDAGPGPDPSADFDGGYGIDWGAGDGGGGGGDPSGGDSGGGGGGPGGGGEAGLYKGGPVKGLLGPNPKGPDEGYKALKSGEYVIKKSSVKKYGEGILGAINQGKIPKRKLAGLLG
jgi:hypothetical protein